MSKARGRSSKRPSSAEDRPVDAATLEKEFTEKGTLGVGAYGSVHIATHTLTGQVVAIKKILVDKSDPVQKLAAEINVLRDLDSTHIVKYLGSFFVKPSLNIVMEYCEAGSVADIMRLRRKTMREPEIATILQGTLLGLQYMHSRRHIHRDIKGGNVLLTRAGVVKLADFGVAGQLSETTKKRKTVIGTPFWMAPEIIQELGHDSLADIWSCGVLAIEMAEGRPPYANVHPMRAIWKIAQSPPPQLGAGGWGDGFRGVLKKCLVKDPRKRSSASALLKMPFIKSAKSPKDTLAASIAEAMSIMSAKLKKDGTLEEGASRPSAAVAGAAAGARAAAGGGAGGDKAAAAAAAAASPDATMLPGSTVDLTIDGDTMVVADDEPDDRPAEQPAFMKKYLEMEAAAAAAEADAASLEGASTPTVLTRELDLTDLRRRLELLAGKGGSKLKKGRPSST
mmetsp:Transcript_20557/g.53437  ORF Transcript_20557/g.53437 Transcript_20557/m.53437 type:complete len:452 (-) Transcript_20557:144-1499(-)